MALRSPFCIVEVALVLRRWVIDLHRLRTFFLSDVRRAREVSVQRLLQGLHKF